MKKRIYKGMLLLAVVTVLLTFILIVGDMYNEFYMLARNELRNEALYISAGFNINPERYLSQIEDKNSTSRITWIAGDGTVLYDSNGQVGIMENHLNRPEVTAALKNGYLPLVIDGINKILSGITNLQELNNKLAIY